MWAGSAHLALAQGPARAAAAAAAVVVVVVVVAALNQTDSPSAWPSD